METSAPAKVRPAEQPAKAGGPERRQFRRLALTLLGRFMRENKQEYPCKLIDLSIGGAALVTPVAVAEGERIVAYFDRIGGLEGHVVRQYADGFAIELIATPHKREKLASQIEALSDPARRQEGGPLRRHERQPMQDTSSSLKLDEGIVVKVKVLDFSISGAALETEARPQIGGVVTLGKLRARVVRHHRTGIGVEFLDIQNPEAVRRYFG